MQLRQEVMAVAAVTHLFPMLCLQESTSWFCIRSKVCGDGDGDGDGDCNPIWQCDSDNDGVGDYDSIRQCNQCDSDGDGVVDGDDDGDGSGDQDTIRQCDDCDNSAGKNDVVEMVSAWLVIAHVDNMQRDDLANDVNDNSNERHDDDMSDGDIAYCCLNIVRVTDVDRRASYTKPVVSVPAVPRCTHAVAPP